MRPIFRLARQLLAGLCASLILAPAQAKLVELADGELSEVTGQAFLNLTTDAYNGMNFTRLNFGMDVEAQLNIKKLQLGLYPRAGEAAGSADIDINNFALGSVNDATGQINPFLIKNPFLELAYKDSKIVGMRLGFSEAQGHLSGDINRITGNIAVDLYGKGSYLATQMNCFFLDLVCLGARGLVSTAYADDDFSAQAQLVNSGGDADPVRGTMIGMVDGQKLSIPDGSGFDNFLLGLFSSSNCGLLSTTTCFPLSNYGTFPVGQINPTTQQFTEAAKGVFLSMQTQDMQWKDQQDAAKFISALAGAFMNLPRNADGTAAITTSFQEAFNGIPRVDTCLGNATKGC
ncbi:MAG TPA: hypothetical protein VJA19_21985 [Pseudomonas sp.]|nr:hypothetical protein [Pseudomonas sp.]